MKKIAHMCSIILYVQKSVRVGAMMIPEKILSK